MDQEVIMMKTRSWEFLGPAARNKEIHLGLSRSWNCPTAMWTREILSSRNKHGESHPDWTLESLGVGDAAQCFPDSLPIQATCVVASHWAAGHLLSSDRSQCIFHTHAEWVLYIAYSPLTGFRVRLPRRMFHQKGKVVCGPYPEDFTKHNRSPHLHKWVVFRKENKTLSFQNSAHTGPRIKSVTCSGSQRALSRKSTSPASQARSAWGLQCVQVPVPC